MIYFLIPPIEATPIPKSTETPNYADSYGLLAPERRKSVRFDIDEDLNETKKSRKAVQDNSWIGSRTHYCINDIAKQHAKKLNNNSF